MLETSSDPKRLAQRTYLTFGLLILAWTAAWLLKLLLDEKYGLSTAGASFLYWTSAKFLIWIIPALWLIRMSGRTLKEVFNVTNVRGWLLWGGGIGLAIASTGFIPKLLNGIPILPTEISFALVNVLVISPTFEEFLMRGAVLGNLQTAHSFLVANLVSAGMFVILHLPGWYFMGRLADNLLKPAGGALSIFLISLLFGLAVRRSNSVLAGMLAHFLNNLSG